MMFNNTQDFGLTRGLKNFTTLFDLGRHFNNRLLEQEMLSQDCFLPLQTIQELGQSTIENGLRIPVKSSTESGHAVQWRREATLVREL